jgi:hypothetical protein
MTRGQKLVAHFIRCRERQRGEGARVYLTNADIIYLMVLISRDHNQTSAAPWAWPEAGELFDDPWPWTNTPRGPQ